MLSSAVQKCNVKGQAKTKHQLIDELIGARNQRSDEQAAEARHQQLLQTVANCSASASGDDFFRALVQDVATVLRVRYAFVSEFAGLNTKVRTLAFWDGGFQDNFSYDLAGTPCELVLGGETRHYPDQVKSRFPTDLDLAKTDAESYLAVPLRERSGSVLGHLAIIDDKPLVFSSADVEVFNILGARAAVEIEHIKSKEKLRVSEDRLARILTSAMDAIITIDDLRRITLFNSAAEQMFGRSAADVIGKPFDGFFPDRFRDIIVDGDPEGDGRGGYSWLPEGLTALRADAQEFAIEGTLLRIEAGGRQLVTLIVRDINERKRAEAQLNQLQRENVYLREEILKENDFDELVGSSVAIKKVLKNVERVASTDATVLLTGETGTGKEMIARALHEQSTRKDRPLIKVNCTALPAGLTESELFGHEKGAFTGAVSRRIGRFELADGGTIFLDEIGDIPLEIQLKLLRVLQEQEFERVGGSETNKVDVRVIAASNRDLEKAVAEDEFRADLYYRLKVFPIELPPLRARADDIGVLAQYFLNKYMVKFGRSITAIGEKTMQRLTSYAWPGNIRELEHLIERAVILCEGETLEIGEELFPVSMGPTAGDQEGPRTMEDVERAHIVNTLDRTRWVVDGPKGAAKILNMNANTLRSRMAKLNIRRDHDIS